MAKQDQKRYIVTYAEEHVSRSEAAKVLDTSASNLQDAMTVLASDAPEDESDCLHFESLGATALPLSEKEVAKLEKDDRVVQVVEDIKVFVFHTEHDQYLAGYRQAMRDIMGRGAGRGLQHEEHSCCCCHCQPCDPPDQPPVPPVPPEPAQPIPWNISQVKADQVWSRVTGLGVKVAIIDTGIDDDHPDLTVSGGASFVPGVGSWDDDQGHGTHVAGIVGARNNPIGVVGVAPDASLYAVKVLAGDGSGQLSWILAGMEWARDNGAQVANMSLGSNVITPNAACIVAYQRAAEALAEAGCIVVAAAGNNGRAFNEWVGQPARCPGFMAVAALDRDQALADFSSRGPADLCPTCGVEISAPGVNINSTWPGGGYRELSGTSMACPHVSGAAALIVEQHPTWEPARIRDRLKSSASDLGA
ncbi:MAG: S8 family peptidase, partial [Anaerolineae bacterium]|nr:S8 family peptidase [Anaerolineae bacterium]